MMHGQKTIKLHYTDIMTQKYKITFVSLRFYSC
jgi:uncharacterized protein Veg